MPATALSTVLSMLARHVPDREIRVMGSRVCGRAELDLDLVVMGDEPLGSGRWADCEMRSTSPAWRLPSTSSASGQQRRTASADDLDKQAQSLRPALTGRNASASGGPGRE